MAGALSVVPIPGCDLGVPGSSMPHLAERLTEAEIEDGKD